MNLKSIRWKLPLTYAGVATITVLVLGGTLLAILRSYYQAQELTYLKRNASAISQAVAPLLSKNQNPPDLKTHLVLLALLSQTRVRLMDAQGNELVAMSFAGKNSQPVISAISIPAGSLRDEKGLAAQIPNPKTPGVGAGEVAAQVPLNGVQGVIGMDFTLPVAAPDSADPTGNSPDTLKFFYAEINGNTPGNRVKVVHGSEPEDILVSVIPAAGTMYGFDFQGKVSTSAARSNQVFRQQIYAADGSSLGSVELSQGPAYGQDIVAGVARGWLVAGLVAILVAGLAGWWISRRISAPLLALAGVTTRMAQGDLSARASSGAEDEFGLLARSFNEMANRVEETVGALRQFASDAAHELHTPLTALHTNLELAAAEQGTRADASASIGQAWEQMQRLEHLTSGLLDLSRIETGAASPSEPLEVGELVRETCEPYASQAEQNGIDFKLELPRHEAWISGQRGRMTRALSNLLSNAVKFTGSGGSIRVGSSAEPDEVQIWVEDSGIGIAEEDLPYIFNRFHRGRNVTAYPGSGLGLAIVKAVVEQHHGRIEVTRLPAGTRFDVHFPS